MLHWSVIMHIWLYLFYGYRFKIVHCVPIDTILRKSCACAHCASALAQKFLYWITTIFNNNNNNDQYSIVLNPFGISFFQHNFKWVLFCNKSLSKDLPGEFFCSTLCHVTCFLRIEQIKNVSKMSVDVRARR